MSTGLLPGKILYLQKPKGALSHCFLLMLARTQQHIMAFIPNSPRPVKYHQRVESVIVGGNL